MSSIFETALKNTLNDEVAITENGAAMFKTSGKKLLDINFAAGSFRNKSEAEIEKMFSEAFYESSMLSVKWLFMLRDVRGGIGERNAFRVCLKWLASVRPEVVRKLIPLCAEYGRWDDLLCLISFKDNDFVQDGVTNNIFSQWAKDNESMKEGKPISLLSKWLPSINTSSTKTVALAKFLCKKLAISEKQYRQTLSKMRKHLNVIEQKMSVKQWSEINYETVPSMANIKYKNAFLRNDEVRRKEFLAKLKDCKAKINSSACFPSDIVHEYSKSISYGYSYDINNVNINNIDATLEAMWKALPNYVKDLDTGSTICVCDSSGSMDTTIGRTSMTAMEVAYSLGIYFSEKLVGPFKDKTITFSTSPKYLDMSNAKTLVEKLAIMYSHSEYSDTNIEGVFDLLLETAVKNKLSQKDIPSNVLIVSDMEMNMAINQRGYCFTSKDKYNASQIALFKTIEKKWNDAGFKMPRLVFWNVNSRINAVPLQTSPSGVALVSGYSPAIAKMVFSAKMDPYDVLIDALNAERYAPVEEAIKDII